MRKKHFGAKTNGGKTCIYGCEKNCIRVCLFYLLNKEVRRKLSVEVRKIIDSNNIIPRSFHVMLTKHDSPERTTSLTTQTLRVHYMNIFTGEIEHETTLRLKEP